MMLSVSFKNIQRNKVRTFLALLGIMIGVASIISLVAIVDGLFAQVQDVVGQVQGIRVVKSSGDPVFARLDSSFEQTLDSFPGVRVAIPQVMGPIGSIDSTTYTFGSARLIGIDFSKQQQGRSSGIVGEVVEGRLLRAGDNGVAVIGKGIKDSLNKFVGSSIKINGEKLKVIGVYSSGSSLLDSSVIVSISDARNILSFPIDKVSAFNVELINPEDTALVVDRLNFQFKDDFTALSSSDLAEQFGDILGNFRLLVLAVAAISSIVAGVGIINTMLMSVIERFSEIGVLKAIGWTNYSVMKMIIFESVLIGVLGGILGILAGFFVGFLIGTFFGLNALITLPLILQVFAYAVFLGLVGGIYPAFVASKMDPVEALRFE